MKKTILITGANGIVAQKLIDKFLINDNYRLISSTRKIANLILKNENVEYIENDDLLDTDVLKSVDIVINTAFPRTQDINILYDAVSFFKLLLKKSVDSGVKGFINISSQSVYGSCRLVPSKELDDLKPEDMYAFAKTMTEEIGNCITNNSSTKYTNIRLASLIGVEYPQRVINKMILFALKNKSISVQNDKNIFGYMYVNDAVEGIYNFVDVLNISDWKQTYNLGVDPNYNENLAYIANIIKNLFLEIGIDIDLDINIKNFPDKFQTMLSDLFYNDVNWKPQISLKDAIIQIFQSILNSINTNEDVN